MTANNLKAILLVGGLGTRLRTVIGDFPKPMVEINRKPFLEYLIIFLKNQGVKEIIMCVGYKYEIVQDFFKDGSSFGIKINYAIEENLLGTAGAIKNAKKFVENEDNFLVLNGDSFMDFDLTDFLNFHTKKSSNFSFLVTKSDEKGRFGNLILDQNHKLIKYQEKQEIQDDNCFVSAGIYIIKKPVLDLIPQNTIYSLEYNLVPDLLTRTNNVFGYSTHNELIDIGTPTSLNYFKENYSNFFKT